MCYKSDPKVISSSLSKKHNVVKSTHGSELQEHTL